jgi:hypothetical protein
MATLRWHVDTQLVMPEMQESDLLFPSVNGKFRAPTVLNKRFADVGEMIGLEPASFQRLDLWVQQDLNLRPKPCEDEEPRFWT